MASVLALISKAVYEQLQRDRRAGHGGYGLGDVVALDRYTSKHAAFAQLAQVASIVLVTVRPKGLLLVAILDRVKRTGEALVGATNRTPLGFINEQLRQLRLADGKGITAPLEKLGMSLQTPRLLAVERHEPRHPTIRDRQTIERAQETRLSPCNETADGDDTQMIDAELWREAADKRRIGQECVEVKWCCW